MQLKASDEKGFTPTLDRALERPPVFFVPMLLENNTVFP